MARSLPLGAVAVAVALLSAGSNSSVGRAAATDIRISVTPTSGLLDAPFRVRVTGLKARSWVTVKMVETALPKGTLTVSRVVRADSSGVADLPQTNVLALVRPTARTAADALPRFRRTIRLSALSGGKLLATTTALRSVVSTSVQIEKLSPPTTRFYGEYLHPIRTSRHTTVLLLGGSGGGMPNGYAASLLASHGFPVLALAYFGTPGLPPQLERIPLEYFQRALTWLAKRLEVSPSRISVVGVSRGGELALLLGSTYPGLIQAVAAYVPSERVNPAPTDFSSPAWTLAGKALPQTPIAVERITGRIFLIGAGEDRLWPSAQAVNAIERRMRERGRTPLTALNYARAGHGAGFIVPNIPTRPTIRSRYGILDLGGSPIADASARADSWPKLLRFLARRN